MAAHEARHAWQYSLLVRSPGGQGEQFLPPNIFVANDDLLFGDDGADNNDDGDCLPEAAFLVTGGGLNIGLPGGSAYSLLDTAGRLVSDSRGLGLGTIQGDSIYDDGLFGENPYLDCGAAARAMRERDATRFSRAIESLRPQ